MLDPLIIPWPVCGEPLRISIPTKRHGRHALGLHGPEEGQHFRGCVNRRPLGVDDMLRDVAAREDPGR